MLPATSCHQAKGVPTKAGAGAGAGAGLHKTNFLVVRADPARHQRVYGYLAERSGAPHRYLFL
jgi:uncharacterized spore protein YtfJ